MSDKAVHMLVFSPHPIDTEWGIGGTVARMAKEGKEVVYVIATNGDKGHMDPDILPEKLAEIREKEQLAAAKILGVKEVVFLRHPDLGLEYTLDFRTELLRLIFKYRPHTVATCDPYQHVRYMTNRDHRILGRIVLDAVWPTALAPNTYRDLLEEGYKTHLVQEILLWMTKEPNFYSDITDTFETKLAAFKCHPSQTGDPVLPEFADRIRESAANSGKKLGCKYAEAFYREEVLQRL
ncbi:PIG-L deacetylase family protein [Chloroflexota bacterium]